MTSLKRVLNPIDYNDEPYSDHRPAIAWNDYGVPIDADPIIQDQTWPATVEDVLGQNGILDDVTYDSNEHGFDSMPMSFAQMNMEQWASENIDPQTSSVTPQPENNNKQVCFGMIYRASVKLRGNMADLDSKLSTGGGHPYEGQYEMSVTKSDDQFLVMFPDETVLGELNSQMEKALESLVGQQVSYQVLAPIRAIRETISRATKEKDAIVRVNINLYGSQSISDQIGRELSAHKVYLQRPDFLRHGFLYDNPHVLKLPNFQLPSNPIVGRIEMDERNSETQKAEDFKKTISDVYSNLKRSHRLVGLEGDDRLRTPLLQHQKEGLDFMCQRENGPIPDEFLLWKQDILEGKSILRHAITDYVSRLPRVETGGGILADEMGMGKTLSILALVLRTLGEAHVWNAGGNTDAFAETSLGRKPLLRTRATLIIANSDLMINEWLQEIDRHFHHHTTESIKTIKYHGQSRETDVTKLRDADIIITTYHTLASDFATGKNPLNQFEWYRLVLDEAHIIRRQSTTLYRNVVQLKARSRWCLTGTPIQNRLEDIGSLFAFIRVVPFHSMSTFRKFIAMPFDEGGKRKEIAIERFTRLLDSLCLRRTKDLLHLPDQHDRVRIIKLSAEEREQYEQTKKMMFRAVKNQVGVFDHKSTLGMFQVQLQLRILCNHGTFQQPFSWNRRKLHLLDEKEDMESSLGREGEVTCSACRQTMAMFCAGSMYKLYTEHCRHVLCIECIEESRPSAQGIKEETEDAMPKDCPLCSTVWGSMSNGAASRLQNSQQPADEENYFRPEGRSSKMEVLITDVLADLWSTKSIVFSCWTHTLDLIERYFKNASVDFKRIDGECPTAKREKILDDFAKNPRLRVLIMTTGTGAVGLNLATANRVFIVEPQWNPSVENQAIARALRLGQEQAVQVTRYVVDKTVEQEMRTLQDRKLEIAGIAWE